MNKIEALIKKIDVKRVTYVPRIYVTAWDKWCISYSNEIKPWEHLCSVVIEPDNEPIVIGTTNSLNGEIGNAKTMDDAVDMISEYINKNYIK